jgi:hypothetical protein
MGSCEWTAPSKHFEPPQLTPAFEPKISLNLKVLGFLGPRQQARRSGQWSITRRRVLGGCGHRGTCPIPHYKIMCRSPWGFMLIGPSKFLVLKTNLLEDT